MKISTNFQDPLIKIVPDSLVVKKMKGRPKNVKVPNNVTTTLHIDPFLSTPEGFFCLLVERYIDKYFFPLFPNITHVTSEKEILFEVEL